MTILEQVTQMKNQGTPDQEIVNNLQQQGISPKEINNALSQSQIKSAISNTGTQTMQPSIMEQEVPAPSPQNQPNYTLQTKELGEQEMYVPPSEYSQQQEIYPPSSQEYSPQQEFYPQEGYGDYSGSATNTDTMIEIAEQVFSEKIQKIQKQIGEINEFKTIAQTKIENTANRLKRIETTIDKLQIAILEKVGSYGQNLSSIKKEMSMMQDSFGKVVDQAVRGHHATHAHKTTKKK